MVEIRKRAGVVTRKCVNQEFVDSTSIGQEVIASIAGDTTHGLKLSHLDLRWADLSGADLRAADLSDSILIGADLSHADLRAANLRSANLAGAILVDATVAGADFTSCFLAGAHVYGVDFRDAILDSVGLSSVRYDSSTQWPEDTYRHIVGDGSSRTP